MNAMIKKYTNKRRAFKYAPDRRFITVYIDDRMSGFIWNTETVVYMDGEPIKGCEFFK